MNNYKMLQEIYKSRGEVYQGVSSPSSKGKKSENIVDAIKNIEDNHKGKKGQNTCVWPDTDPVTFNFRMPGDHQRVMLFENLLYMIESSLKKKEKDIGRRTNEHLISKKDSLLYDKVI